MLLVFIFYFTLKRFQTISSIDVEKKNKTNTEEKKNFHQRQKEGIDRQT